MLEKLLSNLKPGKYEFEGLVLEYQLTDNGYIVKVYPKEEPDAELKEFIDSFKEEVKNTDDDIFVEASEMFPEVSGMTTHELSVLLENAEDYGKVCAAVTYFRNCIKHVANERINYLKSKYIDNK